MTRHYWMFTTGAGMAVLMAAVLGLIVGVAVVAQTIYATTMDHIREYGTLKAMGAPNSYVLGVIMTQAALRPCRLRDRDGGKRHRCARRRDGWRKHSALVANRGRACSF